MEQFRAATNENTRLYFAETIGNPRLDVTDIRLIADDERVIIRTKLEKPSKIKGLALI